MRPFQSRESLENEIWEALKDDKLGTIGIYGTGGVGKTTLAKKLAKRVENEKLFDKVAMTVISQEPDFNRIQAEIAKHLNLNFRRRLHGRIMNSGKRVLIILDDIWKELDFKAIRIPSSDANGGYIKIVVTSRREDVCNKMMSQKNFQVKQLTDEEAWSLFRDMATNDPSVHQIFPKAAREISDECKGLPVSIITLAKTLKHKREEIWQNSLLQLKNLDTEDVQEHVYSCVELSYNLIEREEARSCLLFCCLYPEDYNVPIEDLVVYATGLGLFTNLTLQQTRNRVHALIQELKDSFLLLDGDVKICESVKMHDLVRDAAIRIASKNEHGYMVNCDVEMQKWPYEEVERYRNSSAISLVRREIKDHLVDLECLKLRLLRLVYVYRSQSLPDNFFNGMNELKVLSLEISSLPQPLDVLKKLRTLQLQNLHSGEISAIGALISLEILKIGTDTCNLSELPAEIGQLKNLRMLDLRNMHLRYIPPGVLSRLSKLEELYVSKHFKSWGLLTKDGKTNATLSEIEFYAIIGLRISISDPVLLPKEFAYVNLERFHILIGEDPWGGAENKDSANELNLGGEASAIKDSGVCVLLRKIKALSLKHVSNLKSLVYDLEPEPAGAFPSLETISIYGCDELECLVDGSKQIPLQLQLHCFDNLRKIEMSACGKLKYVFPTSIARGLKQLEFLHIRFCWEMKGVFYRDVEVEDEDEHITVIDKLKTLMLCNLRELISLWVDMPNAASGYLFPNQFKVKEGTLIEDTQSIHPVSSDDMMEQIDNAGLQYWHWIKVEHLQRLDLAVCRLIKVAFPVSVAQHLLQLKDLRISNCEQLQYIVADEEEEENSTKIVLPMLKSIVLFELQELVAFCPHSHISFDLPLLEDLKLWKCPKLETFCPNWITNVSSQHQLEQVLTKTGPPSSIYDLTRKCSGFSSKLIEGIPNMKRAYFNNCNAFEVVFSFDDSHNPNGVLNVLEDLHIHSLSNLLHVWSKVSSKLAAFQNLKVLIIENCESLVNVVSPPIDECVMEQLIQQESKEAFITKEVEQDQSKVKIVFPQLRTMRLKNLPKLESFCIERCDVIIEFPLLEELELFECNQMKSFSYEGSVITPKLEKIKINEFSYPLNNRDLNAIVEKMIFRSLAIKNDTYQMPSHEDLSKVQTLKVHGSERLLNAIPCNFLESFQNLEMLSVRNCTSMIKIFKCEIVDNIVGENVSIFSQLEDIYLEELPKLEYLLDFEIPQSVVCFQRLTNLQVHRCNSLRNIFSSSMAKGLVQLQVIEITSCRELKEVVAEEKDKEEEEGISMHKIIFPQLKSLKFECLSNLTSFYNGSYSLELPLLEDFYMRWCQKMKTFSCGLLITSKLLKVRIDCNNYPLMGDADLNAIVHQSFEADEEVCMDDTETEIPYFP